MKSIINETPITNFTESSTVRIIVEAVARAISEQYDVITNNYSNSILATAVGPALDRLGESLGVFRKKSTPAYSGENNFRFLISPMTGYKLADLIRIVNETTALELDEIRIKAGTLVTSVMKGRGESVVEFITLEDAVLSDGDTFVPIQSTGSGTVNNVGPGTLVSHNIRVNQPEFTAIVYSIICTNNESIDTGGSYESDDDYRARIYNSAFVNMGPTKKAVINAALSVVGVSEVYYSTPAGGNVVLTVVSTTPTVSPGLLQAVFSYVQVVAGVQLVVTSPEYIGIKMKVGLSITSGADSTERLYIYSAVQKAIIDYTNNLPVGGRWIVNEVTQRIMDVSDKIIDFEVVKENFEVFIYQDPVTITSSTTGLITSKLVRHEASGKRSAYSNIQATSNQKFVTLDKYIVVC
jgi:uncharacterized phage protein gp47/JayE